MGGFPSATSNFPQAGTSPKQQIIIPQFQGGGGSSPSPSNTSASRQIQQINQQSSSSSSSSNSQNRKIINQPVINLAALKKRTAPAPPPVNSLQSLYSTLPHAPRHSQSIDSGEIIKSNTEMYSTLPHLRTNDTKNSSFHFDNKMYERFEPLISSSQQAKYDKHRFDSNESGGVGGGGHGGSVGSNLGANLLPFSSVQTHKRSPSGDSIGRNLHLAGAKLVLPTGGEIPSLKPVDKNFPRPRLPPPGPPSNNGEMENGQSNESLCSMDENQQHPTAPPRKVRNFLIFEHFL